jgi:poly(ADP-ribose) polymerase-like protein
MPHVFGAAPTGRSKCRGCGEPIAKGEVRFGESLPNPYAEGEITHWFHPLCAAYKRPEVLLEALAAGADVADGDKLGQSARRAMEHPRVPRIDGAERAPSGQARCRHCHELIERGAWRIRLVFHEEGNFAAAGFVHLHCRRAYFEADDLLEQVLHFSRGLDADERAALGREFDRSPS